MTGPIDAEGSHLIEFLEARIAEQESAIREGNFSLSTAGTPERHDRVSLGQLMLDECAQKRSIIASCKEAAAAEGITDLGKAEGTIAIARRSMLTILAGSHREHPDYDRAWSPAPPTGMRGEPANASV